MGPDRPENRNHKDGRMSEATLELLFWIVVFLVFFYGFRWLQKRNKNKDDD